MKKIKNRIIILTYMQGFIAMQKIVEIRYQQTNCDDFGFLIGIVQLCADGAPVDIASWADWLEAIDGIDRYSAVSYDTDNQIHLLKSNETFSCEEAYKAMKEYLRAFAARGENGDITIFLKELPAIDDVAIDSNPWWKLWIQAVQEVSEGENLPFMQLKK